MLPTLQHFFASYSLLVLFEMVDLLRSDYVVYIFYDAFLITTGGVQEF